MPEFVTSCIIEGQKFQTKYEVLSFHSESEYDWMFEVKKIAERMQGYDWTEIENPRLSYFCFVKKIKDTEKWIHDESGKRRVPVYKIANPPSFYHELKEIAIDEGRWQIPGLDVPPPTDNDVPW